MKNNLFQVASFYKFTALSNLEDIQKIFYQFLLDHKIKGTILLATEGINGTVAGSKIAIEAFKKFLKKQNLLSPSDFKVSISETDPFPRLKVKIKDEIVSIGNELANPKEIVGEYVQPKDWNNLISQEDVLVLDTRNTYEHSIGTFKNSIQPETINFREFPEWVEQLESSKNHNKDQKIAMFCTGGIRCEKASSLLKARGFQNVHHLKGGILSYMDQIDESESLWEGECFVFDDRVALNHKLEVGSFDMCHGCRMPITESDKLSEQFQKGISCPNCFDKKTSEQKRRYAERIKQIDLAKQKNEKHLGTKPS
ncbi:rhodanese-related sulfurtransferase [Gammaproteobacteria bacterium]|nr:rhodanese-related sulfurtransferase [Gammaproteobacteria bacterium]MDB9907318.1 rhodanese-related sulfurtransferase [Gammaproteobacteria bacterium]MDC0091027.1 rhodanese-related sulfurtransferase [Gammaproteobacteria bacterium]